MQQIKPNPLVVISLDALNAQDFEFIKNLPNFRRFLEEGAYVREVESVYPSVTYTCHSSIITGTYPDKHGIHANEIPNPDRPTDQDWHWFEKDIRVPTLFDYAKSAGLKTASVLWPVMAGAPITYNFPEIWSNTGESYFSLYWRYSTKRTLPTLIRNKNQFKGKQQPYLDNFVEALSKDLLTRKKPDLMCMHLIELDHVRHLHGLHGPEIEKVLISLDKRIGRIQDCVRKAGRYEKTNFILLGDHGGTNFDKVIFMNTYFKEQGLIRVDKAGKITSWKAYGNSCAGSVQICIHPDCNDTENEQIGDMLRQLAAAPDTVIKHLRTRSEVQAEYGLSGNFAYVLEPQKGYIFSNALHVRFVDSRLNVPHSYLAEHGNEPTHPDLKTMLFAIGPDIKKGASLEKASIIDEGPTFAKLLGLEMKDVDGRILHELLKG